jgi:hypothetical protein
MGGTEILGNTEKAPVEIDASNVAKLDASPKPSNQEDEPKTDYSSKATNKTSFSDYLVVFPPLELGRILMSGSGSSHIRL